MYKEQLHTILQGAFEFGASDIHLTVGVPPIIRINGELKPYGKSPILPEHSEEMARAIIPHHLWPTFKEKGELDFSYGIPKVSRFRINAYHQRSCVSMAIRVIPTHIPTIQDLFLPPQIQNLITHPQGLILVTGPTGSGKSTTLAAMINEMNRYMRKHIITLEDPIEYLHRHSQCIIDQREVGFDTRSFANGLRACLRQDPDVILVGEMRDLETISTAISAAETGHLVFGTLHTTDAASTIDRIIDVFPAGQQTQIRIQLASVLKAVISQRLFPTVDFTGRRAAVELLICNAAVKNLIRNEKTHQIQSVIQTSREAGMQTMQMAIEDLLRERVISNEAASPYLKGEF
ncbi:twitching motility protein PilT [Bacillus oleivorans]|uniref:Twitching motility protein PilT n=1 Tax=Bacillus oleivorans TaxID=1448271 RepID=A0A285CVG4_9BACI|nr:type IV pilus twitching motility protein PilT [Bacillus oleivorans]SNX71542.1 twitching motility protein PilT [Bacillus oleivorans]